MGRRRKYATQAAAAPVASDHLRKKIVTNQPWLAAFMPPLSSITPSNLLRSACNIARVAHKTISPLPLPLPPLLPPSLAQRPLPIQQGRESYIQKDTDVVLAQLEDVDSIASSQQLYHEAMYSK